MVNKKKNPDHQRFLNQLRFFNYLESTSRPLTTSEKIAYQRIVYYFDCQRIEIPFHVHRPRKSPKMSSPSKLRRI